MLKKNAEEILFFTIAVLYMLILTFSDYLEKINILILSLMFVWLIRLVWKNS